MTAITGDEILARTLSGPGRRDSFGRDWQYNSQSDRHSKVACWAVIFDLMRQTPLLRRQVEAGLVRFGINHEMVDFKQNRKKDLDLVLCRPNGAGTGKSLASLAEDYSIVLNEDEAADLEGLPHLQCAPVHSVLVALEAKACMTGHQKALPRLFDELNSSHLTVHGASQEAMAVAFTMVNSAVRYLSPNRNRHQNELVWSLHRQPKATELTISKIEQLPRRSSMLGEGYDALAIVVIDMANDGTEVRLATKKPAPPSGDVFNYRTMISRLSTAYATRFQEL